MFKIFLIFLLLFSCNKDLKNQGSSIVNYIDNEITGSPLKIEISEDDFNRYRVQVRFRVINTLEEQQVDVFLARER